MSMKHVIFVFENEIVEVWENRSSVEIEGKLVKVDGEVILGFPGEIIVVDASVDYKTKTIEELRQLAAAETNPEELEAKVKTLEQRIAELEALIQQLTQESGG